MVMALFGRLLILAHLDRAWRFVVHTIYCTLWGSGTFEAIENRGVAICLFKLAFGVSMYFVRLRMTFPSPCQASCVAGSS